MDTHGTTVEEHRTMQAMAGKMPEVTLRDLFAMNAMTMFCKGTMFLHREYDDLAEASYQLADAMVRARERKQ